MKGAQVVSMPPVMQVFISELDLLAGKNFPSEELTELFKQHFFDQEILEPYVFFSQERYTRNLLHKMPEYELLLLCWSPQQKSPIHGHEGEKCWMRVEVGELYFSNYSLKKSSSEHLLELDSTVIGSRGFVDGPAVIHRVENLTQAPAISLHLYARPFAQCDIFDKENRIKERIDLQYDSMYGKLTYAR
jgi:predicted metal-dependent enzyme (double-stranded beta helix superfamily)